MGNGVNYNELLFCRDSYLSYNEYLNKDTIDEDAMFDDVKSAIRILTRNGNIVRVYDDGITVSVEYDAIQPDIAESRLMWIPVEKYSEVFAVVNGGNEE